MKIKVNYELMEKWRIENQEPVKEYKLSKEELEEYLNKLLDKFYKKDDIYYYKDKECTQKVVGLLRSKKKKYVKGGILIQEQPYAITNKTYVFRG